MAKLHGRAVWGSAQSPLLPSSPPTSYPDLPTMNKISCMSYKPNSSQLPGVPYRIEASQLILLWGLVSLPLSHGLQDKMGSSTL